MGDQRLLDVLDAPQPCSGQSFLNQRSRTPQVPRPFLHPPSTPHPSSSRTFLTQHTLDPALSNKPSRQSDWGACAPRPCLGPPHTPQHAPVASSLPGMHSPMLLLAKTCAAPPQAHCHMGRSPAQATPKHPPNMRPLGLAPEASALDQLGQLCSHVCHTRIPTFI